jgi:hypothetical protein
MTLAQLTYLAQEETAAHKKGGDAPPSPGTVEDWAMLGSLPLGG